MDLCLCQGIKRPLNRESHVIPNVKFARETGTRRRCLTQKTAECFAILIDRSRLSLSLSPQPVLQVAAAATTVKGMETITLRRARERGESSR